MIDMTADRLLEECDARPLCLLDKQNDVTSLGLTLESIGPQEVVKGWTFILENRSEVICRLHTELEGTITTEQGQ